MGISLLNIGHVSKGKRFVHCCAMPYGKYVIFLWILLFQCSIVHVLAKNE